MKIVKCILLVLFLQCSITPLYAADYDPSGDYIQSRVKQYMTQNKIPGVIVEGYKNGKPFAYYFGYADQNHKKPMTKETIFEIGSISKIMTNLILAQEIDHARTNLNATLDKYLHPASYAAKQLTLKQLATHTAGFYLNVPNQAQNKNDLHQFLATWEPKQRVGSQWIYSNVGIGLIGKVVEAINDHPLNDLYTSRIAKPLGAKTLTLNLSQALKDKMAQGYDHNGRPVRQAQLGLLPAGFGVKASAEDMLLFLSASIGLPNTADKMLYPMRLTQTAFVGLPQRDEGLGWQIHKLTGFNIARLRHPDTSTQLGPLTVVEEYENPIFDVNALYDKTGATAGFRSYIAVLPNKQSGLVVLTNKCITDGEIVELGRDILFKMTGIG